MMEEAVRLKSGIDMLSTDEFVKLMLIYGKQQIGTMLFSHFISQLQCAQNTFILNDTTLQIQEMNENISEIIRSREKINDSDHHNYNKLDDLPSIIISSISSFLQFPDMLSFEKCNRTIFIGSRSPKLLQSLPSYYTSTLIEQCENKENNFYHWNRFNSIKTLEIDIADCFVLEGDENEEYILNPHKQYKLHHIPIWSNLKNLDMSNPDYIGEVDENTEFMLNFSNDLQLFNLCNLETVRIPDYINPNIIFIKAPLLKYVILEYLPNYIDINDIKWPQNLNGIAIQNNDDIKLPTNICNGLQSFHKPQHLKLSQEHKINGLYEICLCFPNRSDIDDLNKQKLNKLQRIHIVPCSEEMENEEMQKSLQLLLSLKSLKYIGITVIGPVETHIFKILRNTMDKTSRFSIKIKIFRTIYDCFDDDDISNGHIVFDELLKLINSLNKKTKHFVLKYNMKIYGDITPEIKILMELFNNKEWDKMDQLFVEYSEINKINTRWAKFELVVTNKHCNINGYKEQWLMTCPTCK